MKTCGRSPEDTVDLCMFLRNESQVTKVKGFDSLYPPLIQTSPSHLSKNFRKKKMPYIIQY